MSANELVFELLPALFLGILLFLEIGRRIGRRYRSEESERERAGQITIETSVYALLGLMVAFTFAGAAARFDDRRTQTVQEANAIGTAYMRLDLLPTAAQPALRDAFRRYIEERMAVYRVLPDIAASNDHAARAGVMQGEIWTGAVAALREAEPKAALLLLPALNEMFDITAIRNVAMRTRTPHVILGTLVVLTLLCSLLVGYGLAGGKSFSTALHMLGFALAMTVTIYVIVDLDHPRIGLIRLDYADQALAEVRSAMD